MRARSGISLFEAIAALTIVAITAMSALSAVGAELRTAERARRALEVEALFAERLDFLNVLSERDLQSLPDSVAEGRFEEPFEEYQWFASTEPNTAYPGLYDVVISIAWPGGSYEAPSAVYRRPALATPRRR